MKLSSGDVVDLDFGLPEGREAGFGRPAVVVTSQAVLDSEPAVVHVVPLTTTIRPFASEVGVEPDAVNGLGELCAVQCQHLRAVSVSRISRTQGNIGPAALTEIRDIIGLLLDIPS